MGCLPRRPAAGAGRADADAAGRRPRPVSASAQRIYERGQPASSCRCARCSRGRTARPASARASSSPTRGTSSPTTTSSARRRSSRSAIGWSTAPPIAARGRCSSSASTPSTTSPSSSRSIRRRSPATARCRFRPRDQPLAQGERIYSLGNPLDVGFAVIEGTYNGLVERSFYPTIFFAGSLNPGVSGGPTLDGQGAVIGVNVAARRDGEQVSFLVPAGVRRGSAAAARAAPRRSPDRPIRPWSSSCGRTRRR